MCKTASFFGIYLSSFYNTIYWRYCHFPIVYSCLCCCSLIDHISVSLFLGFLLCFIDLHVCFTISTILFWLLELGSSFKSENINPPTLFFLNIAFAIQGLLWFHVNCDYLFYFCENWYFERDGIKLVDCTFFTLKTFFYCCLSTVVSIFPPPCRLFPSPPCLQPSNLPTLALSICLLYIFLEGSSPTIPHYLSPLSRLVTGSLFVISMSLVIFCLLVCFVD